VVGVLVEAVVGHEDQPVANLVPQIPDRDLDDAVGVIPARAASVLVGRDPEEDHAGNPEVGQRPHLLPQALLGVLHHARHRRDRLGIVDPFLHEQRRDEVVHGEPGLGHHPPDGRRAPEPAGALFRECHGPPA
jgi:hypothetical protein